MGSVRFDAEWLNLCFELTGAGHFARRGLTGIGDNPPREDAEVERLMTMNRDVQ